MQDAIIADVREKGSGVLEALRDLGIQSRVEQLSIGDYIISSRCAVERKTARDFFSSLFGGRLFEQAQRLSASYEIPLMIIEGDFNEEVREHRNPNAALGALVSLSVTFGLRLVFARDVEQTAKVLSLIRKHHEVERQEEIVIHRKPRIGSDISWQRYIVASFPRVGPVLADRLLQRFRSVKGITSASAAQLAALQGVPKNTAREVHRILNLRYRPPPTSRRTRLAEA